MKKRLYSFIVLSLLAICYLFAQTEALVSYQILPFVGDSILQLGNTYYIDTKRDSFQIETLKFYISGIELWQDTIVGTGHDLSLRWNEKNSYHLIDVSSPRTCSFFLTLPSKLSFNHIKFNLGIDSLTNVSGVLGGDLDPTKGMYWTWQSGYINFKLEGKSNLCPSRNHEFEFHLGGYQAPFYALQKVMLPLSVKPSNSIDIKLDIEKIIQTIDLSQQNHIMSPSKEAVQMANKVANAFSVLASNLH